MLRALNESCSLNLRRCHSTVFACALVRSVRVQFDLRNRRTFLKRCLYPSVSLSDLFIGASVSVFARQLRVLEYADAWTTNKLAVTKAR